MTEPRKHKHAALIQQWLDDDSLEVERQDDETCHWYATKPTWDETSNYRFKPKMIKCGSMEFTEPMRVAPIFGERYWVPSFTSFNGVTENTWDGEDFEKSWLKQGLCHSTRDAAKAHAKALIALTESKS